jgi:hypothetical protein
MTGRGVEKNLAEAVSLARQAADIGDANGQGMLAWAYYEGLGVPKDFSAALTWARLAAKNKLAISQFILGLFYMEGIGTEKNSERGYFWLKIASMNEEIDLRSAILPEFSKAANDLNTSIIEAKSKLTQEQVLEIESRISKCNESGFVGCD